MRKLCVTSQLSGEHVHCYGPFWAIPFWVCSGPSLSPFSVPPREGGFGSNVKWLTLCTRQGNVSLWGAFQAWGSQRQKANFKNPQKSNTQRVGTETPFDSLWVSAICSVPRGTLKHQPQTPVQVCNSSFNSPKPRDWEVFIVPLNPSTTYRTWIFLLQELDFSKASHI